MGWIKKSSWERVLIALFLASIWAGSLAYHGFRGDVQSDLAIGRWILAHHQVPHMNLWMAAAWHHSFSDTEWLYGVIVAVLYQMGGRLAIYGFCVATIVVLSYGLAGWIAHISPLWRWPVTVFLAFLLSPAITPRPVLLTFLGWWAVLEAIRRYRATNNRTGLWVMASLTIVWTQIHMTVVLVPAVLAWELIAGDAHRRKGLIGPVLVAVAGTALRVGGLSSGAGFFDNVMTPALLNNIIEWMPPDPRTVRGVFVFVWLFGVWGLMVQKIRSHRDYASLGWVVGGTVAALFAQRLIPYMAIGTLMLLVSYGPRIVPIPAWISGVFAGALLILVNIPLWTTVSQTGVFTSAWPSSAIALLRSHHATNIISRQGDTLTGDGLTPWLNGQIQLVSHAVWFPVWIDTVEGLVTPAQFADRYNPTSRWIVWPLARATGLPLRLHAPWHIVWRGDIRWNGGTQEIPSAIWERTAPSH